MSVRKLDSQAPNHYLSEMSRFLIIGAGNIGFRHFQALNSLSGANEITLVDPRISERQAVFAAEKKPQTTLHFESDLERVQLNRQNFDFIVSAVTADVQQKWVDRWGSLAGMGILLEKPIAQHRANLEPFTSLSKADGAHLYVNCIRGFWPGYQKLKSKLSEISSPVHLEIEGTEWGLACNGVHMIDLFRWLRQLDSTQVRSSELTLSRLAHKRGPHFEEFTGKAVIENKLGDRLTLISNAGVQTTSCEVRAFHAQNSKPFFVSDESTDRVRWMANEQIAEEEGLQTLHVSRTTAIVAERCLARKPVDEMPSLEEAIESHRALYAILEAGLKRTQFAIT